MTKLLKITSVKPKPPVVLVGAGLSIIILSLIEQLSSFIELTSDQKVYKGLSRHNYYAKN